jgi:hypothetical protein
MFEDFLSCSHDTIPSINNTFFALLKTSLYVPSCYINGRLNIIIEATLNLRSFKRGADLVLTYIFQF